MPFAGLEGSQDAEAENGGDGREPGAKQTNPASIRRRPQIFRKQCRCAKSDGIPFERQLETFPETWFAWLREKIRRDTGNAKVSGSTPSTSGSSSTTRAPSRDVLFNRASTKLARRFRGCQPRNRRASFVDAPQKTASPRPTPLP